MEVRKQEKQNLSINWFAKLMCEREAAAPESFLDGPSELKAVYVRS